MAIDRIDPDRCDGCGICVNSCSMDVIWIDEKNKKAVIKYPEDCMCCVYCEFDCPKDAIYVSPERHAPLVVGWR